MDDQYPLTGSLERNGVYIVWDRDMQRDFYHVDAVDVTSQWTDDPRYNSIQSARPARRWIDPEYRKAVLHTLEEQLIKRRGKQ